MRPNRSLEMPPTKPVGVPSRASPIATLRHDPPTFGRTASRPSAAATGTKSINASPQQSIIVATSAASAVKTAHRLATGLIEPAQHPVHLTLPAMKFSHARRGRLGHAPERRHSGHGLAKRGISPGGDGTKHGRPQQYGLRSLWQRHDETGRIRHDLPHERTSPCAAPRDDHVAVDAMRLERVDHIGKTVSKAAQSRYEQALHGAKVVVEVEARDDSAGIGIGVWRAIAEEFRQDVNVAREQRSLARASGTFDDSLFEKCEDIAPVAPRRGACLRMCRMRL